MPLISAGITTFKEFHSFLVSQSESILLISPLLNTSLSSGTSTTLSLSLPLPPSPSVGVVLPSPSLASPPLTGVGKGVKVSFSPFCSSPEGAGVLVVPEGGAVSVFCPPFSGVLTGYVPLLLAVPLPLDEPSEIGRAHV